jgi:hypothetical protein
MNAPKRGIWARAAQGRSAPNQLALDDAVDFEHQAPSVLRVNETVEAQARPGFAVDFRS